MIALSVTKRKLCRIPIRYQFYTSVDANINVEQDPNIESCF